VRGRELSYRHRRYLVALIAFAVIVGGISAAIIFMPRGQKPDRSPSSPPPPSEQAALRRSAPPTKLTAADQAKLRDAIALFVTSSVARHHPERSWPIVHPSLRQGLTKRQWSTGSIPVVPYPAIGVDLVRLESVDDRSALVEVLLEPTRTSHLVRKTFQIELRHLPRGPHPWLVSSWVPEGVSQSQIDQNAARTTPAKVAAAAYHAQHFSAFWLLLPLGLLAGGVILVPTGLFIREAYQFRRAKATLRRSDDDYTWLRR
jgi:hypothetical protein